MIAHLLAPTSKGNCFAYGATLGQEHVRPLRDRLTSMPLRDGERVIVDFTGIEATTASYVKATILWLFQCGQLAAGVQLAVDAADPFRPIPLDVFPFVYGMVPEVKHEVAEVFAGRKLPCLEAVDWEGETLLTVRLLGAPEETARRTLEFLVQAGEATATLLYDRHPNERISVTGWNNRLADLYGLRLASRTKQGRQWVYAPVAKEVIGG